MLTQRLHYHDFWRILFLSHPKQILNVLLMTLSDTLSYGLTFEQAGSWRNKIFSHLHITSHCLLQLVWLFITTSSWGSFCSRPTQEGDLYPVGRHEGVEEVRCSVQFCGNAHAPPLARTNPSEFGNSPEPCRGGGVQREPEWEAHIVHCGTPPAPARRHNSQGHGELGQRTSRLPTGRAGWEKKEGKFPKCLHLCERGWWNVLFEEIHGVSSLVNTNHVHVSGA